jgi:hypothetical protein
MEITQESYGLIGLQTRASGRRQKGSGVINTKDRVESKAGKHHMQRHNRETTMCKSSRGCPGNDKVYVLEVQDGM